MRVLIVTPFYLPDLGPSAALYGMLAEELSRLGFQVSVISAVPHYPTGMVPMQFRGRLFHKEQRNGVGVTRVWVPSTDRGHLGLRAMTFVCYQFLATLSGLRRKYDVVIISNPALEVFLPFLVLSVLRRKCCIFSVHEIYPDIGVKLGIFRRRPVIQLVDAMERFCYRRSRYVRALSEGYKRALERKGVESSRLHVIADWVDTELIQPLPRQNAFSTRWGLDHSFVIMYAGNIGPTQGLQSVLESARLLANEPSIRFVLVGDGAAKNELQQAVECSGLNNTLFIPLQPRETLPEVLATADISLVTLRRDLGTDSVPSKMYSIMASGRPVIVCVDPNSDISRLVQKAQCGLAIAPEDPQALASSVLRLYQDVDGRRRLAVNGRNFVLSFCSKTQAAQKFQGLILSLGSQQGTALEECLSESQVIRRG